MQLGEEPRASTLDSVVATVMDGGHPEVSTRPVLPSQNEAGAKLLVTVLPLRGAFGTLLWTGRVGKALLVVGEPLFACILTRILELAGVVPLSRWIPTTIEFSVMVAHERA